MGRQKDWKLRGRIYIYIRVYMHKHGMAPTGREIAAECNCNHQKVPYFLRDLEAKGLIALGRGTRSIRLAGRKHDG